MSSPPNQFLLLEQFVCPFVHHRRRWPKQNVVMTNSSTPPNTEEHLRCSGGCSVETPNTVPTYPINPS